jgi:urease beta subunit
MKGVKQSLCMSQTKAIDPYKLARIIIFFEVNEALLFDRQAAYGFRLNIASGTAVRF